MLFRSEKVKTKAVGNADGKELVETSWTMQLVKEEFRQVVQSLNRQQSLQF